MLFDQTWVTLISHNGFLLKMDGIEIPQKKKNAIGVRGMKLSGNDYIEQVHFGNASEERHLIEFNGKKIDLGLIKPQKRDAKGSRIK